MVWKFIFTSTILACCCSSCEEESSCESYVDQTQYAVKFENGLSVMVNLFEFGLAGNDHRLVFSKDSITCEQMNSPNYIAIRSTGSVVLHDTLPAALFYCTIVPQNISQFSRFNGKLLFKEVPSRVMREMMRSRNDNFTKIPPQ